MRTALASALAASLLALAGCAGGQSSHPSTTSRPSTTNRPSTTSQSSTTATEALTAQLTIAYRPDNRSATTRTWTLRCGARPAGTHPQPVRACAELAAHPTALTAPPGICPMVIVAGDPDAAITGTVNGRRVIDSPLRPQCPSLAWTQLHVLITGS